MKNAKKEIKIYIFILIISGIVYTFIQFRMYDFLSASLHNCFGEVLLSDMRNYIITVSSGIFVSSLLGIVISVKDYIYQKKKLLDDIYQAVLTLLNEIIRINYMCFDEPIELVMKVVGEEERNKAHKKLNSETRRMSKKLPKKRRKDFLEENIYEEHEAKEELLMYFKDNLSEWEKKIFHDEELEEILEKRYKEKVKKYINDTENVIASFAVCNKLYCNTLTSLIGDLDFLMHTDNKKIIHKNIYTRMHQQITYIRRIGCFCDSYKNYGDYDKLYLMTQIKGLQETMFDLHEGKFAYNRFLYEMEQNLHKLLLISNKKNSDEELTQYDFWAGRGCYMGKYLPIQQYIEQNNKSD